MSIQQSTYTNPFTNKGSSYNVNNSNQSYQTTSSASVFQGSNSGSTYSANAGASVFSSSGDKGALLSGLQGQNLSPEDLNARLSDMNSSSIQQEIKKAEDRIKAQKQEFSKVQQKINKLKKSLPKEEDDNKKTDINAQIRKLKLQQGAIERESAMAKNDYTRAQTRAGFQF